MEGPVDFGHYLRGADFPKLVPVGDRRKMAVARPDFSDRLAMSDDPRYYSYMSDVAKAGPSDRPRYLYPEQATAEEREQMTRRIEADGDAYLRWLAGEGPDPCPPESSD